MQSLNKKKVWILGLNHSGTTVFWQAFRDDKRFLCFDEPLCNDVGVCFPNNNAKKTFDEFIQIFGHNPKEFWAIYSPIFPIQEINQTLNVEQKLYISELLGKAENVVIDETHLHYHISSIKELTPEGNVIHLYRRASCFVTSHLKPDFYKSPELRRSAIRWLRYEHNKINFWTRNDFPPGMYREEVIGSNKSSKFGILLKEYGYDVNRIMSCNAIVKLLAYWHFNYHFLESEGSRLFGDNYRLQSYEDFAKRARQTMIEIYRWLDLALPENIDYSYVHTPKEPYQPNNRKWNECARIAGFNDSEIEMLL